MPRIGQAKPRSVRLSSETRRLIAETRVLEGMLAGPHHTVTNDEVIRAALRRLKRNLRAALMQRGWNSDELSKIQKAAVEKHTPRSINRTDDIDHRSFTPVPVVDD